jgi:hypothetical protein
LTLRAQDLKSIGAKDQKEQTKTQETPQTPGEHVLIGDGDSDKNKSEQRQDLWEKQGNQQSGT